MNRNDFLHRNFSGSRYRRALPQSFFESHMASIQDTDWIVLMMAQLATFVTVTWLEPIAKPAGMEHLPKTEQAELFAFKVFDAMLQKGGLTEQHASYRATHWVLKEVQDAAKGKRKAE